MELFGKQGTVVDVKYRPQNNETSPWAVIINGSTIKSTHRKKSAAKRKAKTVAKRESPSELNIYTKDGVFQTGNEYS